MLFLTRTHRKPIHEQSGFSYFHYCFPILRNAVLFERLETERAFAMIGKEKRKEKHLVSRVARKKKGPQKASWSGKVVQAA